MFVYYFRNISVKLNRKWTLQQTGSRSVSYSATDKVTLVTLAVAVAKAHEALASEP